MKTAIAIFCKTPGLSPLKTRLGAEIGVINAENFYRLSLHAIRESVDIVISEYGQEVDAYWAVAEKEALTFPIWNSFQCIWTGKGDLGERINHTYDQLLTTYEQVIIIGSDSPQITKGYLVNAINTLSHNNIEGIIGPCRDGGFVLFGSKIRISSSVWSEIVYSREDTLKQLRLKLDKMDYNYHIISELGDVDNYDDMIMLEKDFIQLGSDLQYHQTKLKDWLQEVVLSHSIEQKSIYHKLFGYA